ncbi:hypothetical protein [Peribacillus huizhouensis]|uniref:Resolvase HTH domain-containing protein n=1 Tax=Peribacillus huizhouensis TaxID=1501239 RepID=A0ABR6CLJ0_9BACI|nr:hypothetical protein [Peribacillus huizhouensis]MBA9025425.1 hypothetical protein [Peribacillus huizhouensis]
MTERLTPIPFVFTVLEQHPLLNEWSIYRDIRIIKQTNDPINKYRGERMEYLLIGLFTFSIILLLISFFKKDHVKLEEEMEQMAITHMQEMYQIKKKIKILEEELLIQETPSSYAVQQPTNTVLQINEILKSQVLSLYHQGLSLEQIAKQSTLSMDTVITVIEEATKARIKT